MNTKWIVAWLGAIALSSLGCSAWECGYGGPGCGSPGLMGFCHDYLVDGEEREGVFVYFDDTGAHEAKVTSIKVNEPSILDVERMDDSSLPVPQSGDGAFLFRPKRTGDVTLDVKLEGWQEPCRFELHVRVDPVAFPEEVQLAESEARDRDGPDACLDDTIRPVY